MNKTITFLAVALMAVSAFGQSDSFDGAAPDQFWGFTNATGAEELWTPAGGPVPNPPGPGDQTYTVSFGSAATLSGAVTDGMIAGLLYDSSYQPVAYTGGSVEVSGVLNSAGTAHTSEPALIGFVQPVTGGFNAYGMGYSPEGKEVTLFAYSGTQYYKLAALDMSAYAPNTLMDIPVSCTLQINVVSTSAVSLVGFASVEGNPVGMLAATAGVTVPSFPEGSEAGDIPVISYGAVGFVVNAKDATGISGTVDNFNAEVADALLTADFNFDGIVDVNDLSLLAANYGGTGKTLLQGDANFDGIVDVNDLSLLAANYGSGTSSAPVAAPEPATMSLLAVGALALIRRRK